MTAQTPDDNERIAALERDLRDLRAQAEQSDGNLAYLLGIVAGLTTTSLKFDAESMLKTIRLQGWPGTVLERFSAGQEVAAEMRQARR